MVKIMILTSLLLCALLVQVAIGAITDLEANCFYYFNGLFSNKAQIGPNAKLDLLAATLLPIVVNAIGPDPLLLIIEGMNGKILRAQFQKIKETAPNVITFQIYNVTKPSLYQGSPETFNLTELSSLTMEDIVLVKGCTATFELDVDKFIGAWEDCSDRVNEHYSHYVVTLECDYFWANMPSVSPEKFSLKPYHMDRVSERYPLIDAPENFVSICDKKQNNGQNKNNDQNK